jgi:hypothetical protein
VPDEIKKVKLKKEKMWQYARKIDDHEEERQERYLSLMSTTHDQKLVQTRL